MRLLPYLASAALAVSICGCGHRPPETTPSPGRVVLLGFDGLDPRKIEELVRAGRLPRFAQLRTEGAWGPLRSFDPMLSPILWTTIATGRSPREHGITGFTVREPSGPERPVASFDRRGAALWNLTADAGLSPAVVGWWATWPAESIDGIVISDRVGLHFLLRNDPGIETAKASLTHPPELVESLVAPHLVAPENLSFSELTRFARIDSTGADEPFRFGDDLDHLRWAIATARSYEKIGLELLRQRRPDLLMVYFEVTDTVAHLFGHLDGRDGLVGDMAAQQQIFGGAVDAAYELADEILGRFLDAADDRTTILAVSDHGFDLGEEPRDASGGRDLRRVSHESHHLEGCLGIWGYRVQPGVELRGADLADIAPTVLALLGIPEPAGLAGRIPEPALPGVRRIAGTTSAAGPDVDAPSAADGTLGGAPELDRALLDKLRSLGYLDGSGSEDLPDPNLAALAIQDGRYEEAVAAYRILIEAEPDRAEHHANLAAALGGLGMHVDALAAVDKALDLQPTAAFAHFTRGLLLERLERPEEAVEALDRARRLNPAHAGSKQALARLATRGWMPRRDLPVETQKRLQRAQLAATRGDYESARRELSEVEGLHPGSPVVYEVRANVEYLAGDRAAATAALERAVALDPDDPILRANLAALVGSD